MMNKIPFLFVFFSLVLMALPGHAKVYRPCTLSPDGTTFVNGMNGAMVFYFHEATSAASMPSSLGLKGVTMGDCLYVFGENNQNLKVDYSKHDVAKRSIGNAAASNTYEKVGGWPEWYGHFARVLTKSWDPTTPGQVQVLLQVSRDGNVRLLKYMSYTPGKNQAGEFVTSRQIPTLENGLVSDIQCGLSNLPRSEITFPTASTATSVKFIVNCIADRDLLICFPTLWAFRSELVDDKELERRRIAAILESGYLYRHAHFVCDLASRYSISPSATHRMVAPSCFVNEHLPNLASYNKRSTIIDSIIEHELRQSKLDVLESFSMKLTNFGDVPEFLDPIIFHQLERQNRHEEAAAFKSSSDSSHWYPVD